MMYSITKQEHYEINMIELWRQFINKSRIFR